MNPAGGAPVRAARPVAQADPAAADARRAELRRQCRALEGVFVRQLFEAMRRATPRGDGAATDPGQEAFTGLLDDALSVRAAEGFERGLGEALYRQLSRRLDATGPAGARAVEPPGERRNP